MSVLTPLTGRLIDRLLGFDGPPVDYTVRRSVAVPMPDGVALLADHYRPAAHDRPLPVVLVRTPYGRSGLTAVAFALPYARRGFQLFLQSTRGTFGSGGQFRPFTTEREDGLATLAWIREQPWCDGRVATIGPSYLGHTQWSLAPYADPPLVAVALNITAARMTSAFYDQHAPGVDNALSWTASIGTQERGQILSTIPNPVSRARRGRAMRKVPLQAADVDVAGAPVTFWRDFVDHAAPGDPFWAEADHDGADLSAVPPVSMVTGWWDLFVAEQLKDFTALRRAGVDARLLVGPWQHGEPGEVKAIVQADVAWLDHHLNDAPAPSGARVRVALQATSTWLDFDSWPPAATPTAYHLRAGGRLDETADPDATEPDRFVYDPSDPTPTVGGPLLQLPAKQADNAAVERRDDVLVYTTAELADALDVVGPVTARIFVRTDLDHADVFVRVCDVDAKGVSRNVVDGIRRLSPAAAPDADADGVWAVDVDLFPTAYRFERGHRIRVQVSGGAFPRFARSTGTDAQLGAATSGLRCRFEVFHDERRPSAVTLPVLE